MPHESVAYFAKSQDREHYPAQLIVCSCRIGGPTCGLKRRARCARPHLSASGDRVSRRAPRRRGRPQILPVVPPIPKERADPPPPQITVLDVLEGFFGAVPDEAAVRALNQQQIEELGDLVVQSAAVTAAAAAPEGTVYPGGWLAGNWHEQLFSGHLTLALLYYPRLLVHDPLADFFFRDFGSLPPTKDLHELHGRMTVSSGPAMWARDAAYDGMRGNLDAVRSYLARVITFLVDAAPLLRSSVLITRSQWPTILHRTQPLMTSVRYDVRSAEMQAAVASAAAAGDPVPSWDTIRGLNIAPASGLRASDEPWQCQHEFFFLAKTLAVANAAGATYVPPTEPELDLLRVKVTQAGRAAVGGRQPLEMLAEVARVLLPDFQLDAHTAVAMRNSEDAFDDWQRGLRSLAHAAEGPVQELRERVEDELVPKVRRVRQAADRSSVMRQALKDTSATTVFSAAVAAGAAGLAGGNPVIQGGAAAVSGVLQWAWKAYRPPSLGGSEAVLATLIRGTDAGQLRK